MLTSNERLKRKYAYNINDSTKIKKVTMGSGNDFLSLNRGFYDDIENKDISIKKNNRLLKRIKNDSLKEFVFTNVQIPDKWRNKLDYQNSVIKILARDSNFLAYVGRGGNTNKNETTSTKMYTRDNLTVSGNLKKKRGFMTKSGTCYSQLFPRIDRSRISFEEKKFSGEQNRNKLKINEDMPFNMENYSFYQNKLNIRKLKEQSVEKLSYKIYIIFYNQKDKAQQIKNGLVISRKQLNIINNWNQNIKKKKLLLQT